MDNRKDRIDSKLPRTCTHGLELDVVSVITRRTMHYKANQFHLVYVCAETGYRILANSFLQHCFGSSLHMPYSESEDGAGVALDPHNAWQQQARWCTSTRNCFKVATCLSRSGMRTWATQVLFIAREAKNI